MNKLQTTEKAWTLPITSTNHHLILLDILCVFLIVSYKKFMDEHSINWNEHPWLDIKIPSFLGSFITSTPIYWEIIRSLMTKLGVLLLFIFSMLYVAMSNNLTLIPEQITFPHPLCRSQIALVNFACAMVPVLPMPQSPPPPEDGDGHRHRHRRRHRHRHRHVSRETPEQRYCCEWLRQMDSLCVCEILYHLPPFLWKPNHKYTIVVDDECSVTFLCEGRQRLWCGGGCGKLSSFFFHLLFQVWWKKIYLYVGMELYYIERFLFSILFLITS